MSCNWHYNKSPSYNDFASTDAAGKWCIFVTPAEVDEERSKIRDAIESDQLMCAKVSTALRSMSRDGHVICVYTRDWADMQDIMRAREVLRSLGFLDELSYKVILIPGAGNTASMSGTWARNPEPAIDVLGFEAQHRSEQRPLRLG
ncbi:DUF1917 domain-containing protein [Paraburkholderia fungorum]|uniref:putative phosphothreonine lyase domain-containing protein n=1 Tax=Paraburkholderia fungorum TaxID=134537 RepID=UPI0038BA2956